MDKSQKIVESKLRGNKMYDIEIQRKDPASPLYSVKSFEALPLKPELLKCIQEMGIDTPWEIQGIAVPTLLADPPQNMIVQSPSHTGKTAAFIIAMLNRVKPECQYTQVLCLCPTYEIAKETGDTIKEMAKFYQEIKIKYALHGEEKPTGKEHIMIGTPEKLVDWGVKYKFIDLSKLTVFVLDEADIMISTQGYQKLSLHIGEYLPKNCQIMMLFSDSYDPDIMRFAEMMVPNAVIIKLLRRNLKQYYVKCKNEHDSDKYLAITNIYSTCTVVGQIIIFCQTETKATWLFKKLTSDGHAVALLIGDLAIEQRIQILDRFREGERRMLITTNALARGIDIKQITVVNWDLPVDRMGNPDCKTYLHCIGRAGRFIKSGIAINLINIHDDSYSMAEIKRHFGTYIELLETDDLEKLEKKLLFN